MINAANIVARRISHGHVTVCTAISEGQRRRERERETRIICKPGCVFRFLLVLFPFFFLNTRTDNTAAIDERVDDSRLWTLLIYSSMEMVINLDTSDRNRLALRARRASVRTHARYTGHGGTAFGD